MLITVKPGDCIFVQNEEMLINVIAVVATSCWLAAHFLLKYASRFVNRKLFGINIVKDTIKSFNKFYDTDSDHKSLGFLILSVIHVSQFQLSIADFGVNNRE